VSGPGPAADPPIGAPEGLARAAFRFRLVLGLATLVMLGLSRPLWAGETEFPRVPFVRGLPELPEAGSRGVFGLLLLTVALGIVWRRIPGISLVPLAWLILQDQHRFQPWAYQYGMTALALALLPPGRSLLFARLFVLALYIHSGLSKLDLSFCQGLGALFLHTALKPLGISPWDWTAAVRTGAVLVMPSAEIAVAVGLAFRKTRRWALAGAIALHSALIGILGPWGLGHSTIVLVWNAALIAEDWLLFGPSSAGAEGADETETWATPLVTLAFLGVVALPFGERWGAFDSWPSFALYAGHTERTDVFLHEEDLDAYPEAIRRHLSPVRGSPWRRLDVTGWSRSVRGVPAYPQGRAGNGVAEALASRHRRAAFPVRVIQWGRADRWTGERARTELYGYEKIRRHGDSYRINAHPSGGIGGAGRGDRRG
jgi:hypothetical protein